MVNRQKVQASQVKRSSEISLPVPVPLLLPPLLLPLLLSSTLLPPLGRRLHCISISGLEVCDLGSFGPSKPQALLVPLQHGGHGLPAPLPLRSQSCSGGPAAAHHHLVADAGWREAVVRRGRSAAHAELVQGGGEVRCQAAAVVAAAHVAPARLHAAAGRERHR